MMKRIAAIGMAAGTVAAGLALMGAQPPAALAQASGGVWELSGLPGGTLRQCFSDAAALAVIEHRGKNCTRSVLSDGPNQAVIHSTCAGGGFGDSKLTRLTSRSLRIETQGISDQLPFNYVVQARRVGDCNGR